MDWIHLAQERDRWHAIVNAVIKPEFLRNVTNLLSS